MEMSRGLITRMLQSREELAGQGARWTVKEDAQFELLLAAASGTLVPLSRVRSLDLDDNFLTAHTDDADYVLPYEVLIGVKVTSDRGGRTGGKRTGFLP